MSLKSHRHRTRWSPSSSTLRSLLQPVASLHLVATVVRRTAPVQQVGPRRAVEERGGVQRSLPAPWVRGRERRTTIEQGFDGRGVREGGGGRDGVHGEVERREASGRRHRGGRPPGEQRCHHSTSATLCRRMQSRPAPVVARLCRRPPVEQQPHHRLLAPLCCQVQRRVLHIRPCVHLTPVFDEQSRHGRLPLLGCDVQARVTTVRACVHRRPSVQQHRHRRAEAEQRSEV